MFKRKNNVSAGWIWVLACFIVLILGCNHLYGYSLVDSFLDIIGIGSWTMEGQFNWHITSFIMIPLFLLCMIQSVRHLRGRYPNIAVTLFICTIIWNGIYPKITERIVSFGEILIK